MREGKQKYQQLYQLSSTNIRFSHPIKLAYQQGDVVQSKEKDQGADGWENKSFPNLN